MSTVWLSRDCSLRSRVISEALTVGGVSSNSYASTERSDGSNCHIRDGAAVTTHLTTDVSRRGASKTRYETLEEVQSYVKALIEYRDQSVDTDDLPGTAELVDEPDSIGNGTVVKENITCGDGS